MKDRQRNTSFIILQRLKGVFCEYNSPYPRKPPLITQLQVLAAAASYTAAGIEGQSQGFVVPK